ncbi:MAG TPA: biotin/lipoyl-containing protein, partial [Methylocella sp.]|nr:biotin/lipoyl-containing protein [Methylocella sp.]
MATEIRTPALGESVTEATVGRWFKSEGDFVKMDEPVVELETDKVTLEVNAPVSGVLSAVAAKTGETVKVGSVLGQIGEGAARAVSGAKAAAPAAPPLEVAPAAPPPPELPPAAPPRVALAPAPSPAPAPPMPPSPAAAKIAADLGVETAAIEGSGKRGQVLKSDVLEFAAKAPPAPAAAPQKAPAAPAPPLPAPAPGPVIEESREERVPMTRLRQTIARRLKDAQNTAAMLTTFNEADMSAVIGLRARFREEFERKHGVKLGFMSFFVKAC